MERTRQVTRAEGEVTSTGEVSVQEIGSLTEEVAEGVRRLVPMLSASAAAPTDAELAEIVGSPQSALFVAREGATIVGSLTLAWFRIPTGVRAWIEDVVVDESYRGRGIGAALTEAAIARAAKVGAKTVDLTSRPSREAANRLYLRMGFEQRETNVYRINLE